MKVHMMILRFLEQIQMMRAHWRKISLKTLLNFDRLYQAVARTNPPPPKEKNKRNTAM
jgi:hypothetical protein